MSVLSAEKNVGWGLLPRFYQGSWGGERSRDGGKRGTNTAKHVWKGEKKGEKKKLSQGGCVGGNVREPVDT